MLMIILVLIATSYTTAVYADEHRITLLYQPPVPVTRPPRPPLSAVYSIAVCSNYTGATRKAPIALRLPCSTILDTNKFNKV